MNISKISTAMQPSFGAKMTISAPESLLSKEDREILVELGSQIGTDKDTIDITLGELEPNRIFKNILGYDFIAKVFLKGQHGYIYGSDEKTVPLLYHGEKIEFNEPREKIEETLRKLEAFV